MPNIHPLLQELDEARLAYKSAYKRFLDAQKVYTEASTAVTAAATRVTNLGTRLSAVNTLQTEAAQELALQREKEAANG
jgi:hypothetical protein